MARLKSLLAALTLVGVCSAHAPGHRTISAAKKGKYSAKATYLVLPENHPLAGVVNTWARNLARKEIASWTKEAIQGQKEFPSSPLPWEFELSVEARYLTPDLASIRINRYDYSGGAHPNHGSEAVNYWKASGAPVRLYLKDLFVTGFNGRGFVTKLLIDRLKKMEGADLVQNGELREFDADQLDRFFLSPTSVTWHFNPYEVGPYAAGDFDVKLSLSELGPSFRRALLIAR